MNIQAGVSFIQKMLEEANTLQDADELQNFLGLQLGSAEAHMKVIEQWGRFPHRNAILGRANTPEEETGMAQGTIPSF